jgi:Tfp pilus assembly protein PilF/LysM repeat protein
MKRFLLVLFLIVGCLAQISAQSENKPEIQYWAFMVRNTARLQEIAYRFQVTEADIKKNSDLKGKTVYPGKVIVIPVKVRPATWDPTKFNPNKPFLSGEDARPQLDFEWDNDALDPLLKDDYILISEIKGDSIQTEKMNKHIGKIDKQIAALTHQIDSIKNTEFSFQYDEKDMNAVLKRMEKARQRYYAQSPLGKEVDSLNDVKTKLNEEINRLRNKLSEYDYLNENAYYFEKNREGEADMLERINNRPGEQLIAESNYVKKADNDLKKAKRKNRVKKKKNQAPAPVETEQLLVRDIVPVDTSTSNKARPTVAAENHPNDNTEKQVIETEPAKVEQKPTPTVTEIKKEETTPVAQNSSTEKKAITPVEQKTEASVVTEKNTTEPAKDDKLLTTKLTLNSNNTAVMKPNAQPEPTPAVASETVQNTSPSLPIETKELPKEEPAKVVDPVVKETAAVAETNSTIEAAPQTIPVKEEPKAESTTEPIKPQETTPVEQQVTQTVITEKPTQKEEPVPPPAIEQKVEEVTPERNTTSSVQIPQENAVKPLSERDLSMKEEIKKAIANKVLAKEIDPLDEYSDSPDFAFKGLNFQSISVGKGKNGPKYLTPVDPITALKAKIWIEKFKEEMKIKDFKKAELYLRKAIETNPNSAESWTYHAEMLSAAGDAQEAQKEYLIATAIDAAFARPYYKMALLYENSNNVEKAYEYYAFAIESDSSFYKAYLNRANLSLRLGDLKSAIDDYSTLLDVNKNFSLAHKERGALRMMDRDYAGAVEDFNAYMEMEDPSGEVLYKRGVAKVYTGKIIEGCNDFNMALQLKYTDAAKAIKKYCE